MTKRKAAFALATWFGCGYWPKGPGTVGSLGALLPAWILWQYDFWPPYWFAILAAVVTVPGIWAASEVAVALGRKDPQIVVIDEVLGLWVTLAGATALNAKSGLLAFGLFRLFDIWKPWPVRAFERLPSGTGIVADDLMAGIYAALVLFGAGCLNLY